jgi:hypothetical protein
MIMILQCLIIPKNENLDLRFLYITLSSKNDELYNIFIFFYYNNI